MTSSVRQVVPRNVSARASAHPRPTLQRTYHVVRTAHEVVRSEEGGSAPKGGRHSTIFVDPQ